MNFHNVPQVSYLRNAPNLGVRQQLHPQGVFDLLGGIVLWKAVGKIILLIFPFFLAINMFLSSARANVERSLVIVDNHRHELQDKNIGLLAQKARLYAPERVSQMAGDRLSLYVAQPSQIERIN
ncbi:MAG: hypothetical protein V2B20_24965 [Pseudomonadota bacterium]